MRDLTRLLYMVNKKPENVRIPPDGLQLLTWSEQILNRYLVAQVGHVKKTRMFKERRQTCTLLFCGTQN